MTAGTAAAPAAAAIRSTAGLLAAGMAAGVVYVGVGLTQILFRDGFDLREHQLSVASNGSLGWIQILSFVLTGLLTVACAAGMRRALTPGKGARWGPRLVGAYGVGLVGAGVFVTDPLNGFPPGTPDGPPAAVSWHGLTHLAVASLAFVALIAASFVLARRLRRSWRWYSIGTGSVLLVTWLGIGAASGVAAVNIAFVAAALNATVWVAAVAGHLRAGSAAR